MLIARQLQEKNRAEFLLYMWQVEDIIRAHHCNIDCLRKGYLSQFNLPESQQTEQEEWYANLCNMMREEGKTERGHLQINRNIIEGLAEVHHLLIHSVKFPFYRELYYKVLPYIVELRAKKQLATACPGSVVTELELCFEMLYGLMLLRLKKEEISAETQAAAKDISVFLGQLSDYYKANQMNALTID